jgi:hypothetical protein
MIQQLQIRDKSNGAAFVNRAAVTIRADSIKLQSKRVPFMWTMDKLAPIFLLNEKGERLATLLVEHDAGALGFTVGGNK